MAAEKPTLLMIDGVIREVVEEAGGGVFIPPGDPKGLSDTIKLLISEPDRLHEMGVSARKYLEENFRRADQADAMEKIFEYHNTRDF
jgi:glycosyltransferase involved in cell wall biosynthesis